MSENNAENTSTYLQNFQILEDAASELAAQETPDVDAIIPIVKKGQAAHAVCIERIEAVEAMLKEMGNGQN